MARKKKCGELFFHCTEERPKKKCGKLFFHALKYSHKTFVCKKNAKEGGLFSLFSIVFVLSVLHLHVKRTVASLGKKKKEKKKKRKKEK